MSQFSILGLENTCTRSDCYKVNFDDGTNYVAFPKKIKFLENELIVNLYQPLKLSSLFTPIYKVFSCFLKHFKIPKSHHDVELKLSQIEFSYFFNLPLTSEGNRAFGRKKNG